MITELLYPFDAGMILKKRKSLRRQLLSDGSERVHKKIAVLGGSTTSHIVRILELFLLNEGIEPEFFECEYAQYEQEALFPSEAFAAFHPDVIFIHTSARNIRNFPKLSDSREETDARLQEEFKRFRTIWKNLFDRFRCPIIQNNFEMPYARLLGNRDVWDTRGRRNFTERLNAAFAEAAAANDNLYICDLAWIAADYGLQKFSDPYYWNMYKYCMCMDAIPSFAHNVACIIKSLFGKNRKALALDLDNTLWGGVIGDDGQEGIEIGQENGTAQTYYEFQTYLKSLKDLGILLTIDSKNDEENALAGLNHPESALTPVDFVDIKANWENKDRNLLAIASDLNILPESIVFVDDNPAERAIVRGQIPGAAVPEMERPERYIADIDRNGFFETTVFSKDDLNRTQMYMENMQRSKAEAAFSDYGEYLTSLQMKAQIRDFEPVYIPRITQLTNKSNQFNLTTRRYTEAEIRAVAADPAYIGIYGRLTDRFGDNGVVSVVIGKLDDKKLHIDLWLMSCRVLKRDMEQAMLDALVEKAEARGVRKILGYYRPTKKNHMVEKLYGRLGFTLLSTDAEGNTVWELQTEGYQKQNRYIGIEPQRKYLSVQNTGNTKET